MIRLAPERPLPLVAFVPGKTPRPGAPSPPYATRFDEAAWTASSTYVFGFDLFNHGFPWEAHEAWEALWHKQPRGSVAHRFLQALIKLAAAHVKRLEGAPRGMRAHADSAAEMFRAIGVEHARFAGIDLGEAERAALAAARGEVAALLPTEAPRRDA